MSDLSNDFIPSVALPAILLAMIETTSLYASVCGQAGALNELRWVGGCVCKPAKHMYFKYRETKLGSCQRKDGGAKAFIEA
jgi:hypothetical protein